LADNPPGGEKGAAREIIATVGAMGDLDPFTRTGKDHRVLAHHVAGAKRLNPDLFFLPFSDHSFSRKNADLVQISFQRPGDDLGHLHGRAAGRIFFEAMVHLDDLDVVVVAGHTGGVGQDLENEVDAHAHVWRQDAGDLLGEVAGCGDLGIPIVEAIGPALPKGDVVIDFTEPSGSLGILPEVAKAKKAIVIGTTGFSKKDTDQIRDFSKQIPCVLSPNMSVGVNLIFKILADTARVTGDDYDVEIVEVHHRFKKDAPSGTAMKMAEVVAGALKRNLDEVGVFSRKGVIGERKKKEIGIQSLRAGDVVGEHTVIFAGPGERIEITHRAHSRDNFARGALLAARWIVGQPPGLYDMQDVLGLKNG